jgi:hypothetical protein
VNKKARRLPPLALQDGALILRMGVVLDACCSGLHMLPSTAALAGWRHGAYLQIESDAHSTSIVRRLIHCREVSVMRPNYVYLDPQSAHYLLADLHENLRVKEAEYEMETP